MITIKNDTSIYRIRRALVRKILYVSGLRRGNSKMLYFKEPMEYGSSFKIDRIDSQTVYFEDHVCAVAWDILRPKEILEIYNKVVNNETYCFYYNDDSLCKKVIEPKGKITITKLK